MHELKTKCSLNPKNELLLAVKPNGKISCSITSKRKEGNWVTVVSQCQPLLLEPLLHYLELFTTVGVKDDFMPPRPKGGARPLFWCRWHNDSAIYLVPPFDGYADTDFKPQTCVAPSLDDLKKIIQFLQQAQSNGVARRAFNAALPQCPSFGLK